ncbi:hypothetical protein Aperf_G00000127549 [Anoplocephala perfoliata]
MDTLVRLAHLSEEDLISIPNKVAESLAIAFDSVNHEATETKDQLRQYEKEQKLKLEAATEECSRLQSELNLANTNLTNLREALVTEEKRAQELCADRSNLSKRLLDSQSITNELEMVVNRLENDKERLNELLNQKNAEYERISSEIREMKEEGQSFRKMKSDTITQMEEVKTEKALLDIREKHLEETSASIKQENAWLEEKFHEANDKLLSIRRDYSEKLLSLESELTSKKTELENTKSVILKLEDLVKKLTESNEDHIDKLKLRTDELTQVEQMHASELEAQRRLTDLYKEKSSSFEKKCDELQKAVVDLQELLQQGHNHMLVLQSEKKSIIDAFNTERESLVTANANLANELSSVKKVVEKFRVNGLSEEELLQINPAIASTLASLKSGRSLVDIYADYLQVVEERDRLRVDKDLLDSHIRELVEQLEEKAPVLRSQQEAFKKLKERTVELEGRLEAAQLSAKEKEENFEYQLRRAGYFQRQTLRLKDTCKDLSVQVKTLLYELETARGTVIANSPLEDNPAAAQIHPDSSTDDIDSRQLLSICSAAASVIDNNLVTFKSLSDLQTQNARLLLVARDLASQLETHEANKESLDKHVSEITAKVDALSGEVEVARLTTAEARSEAKFAIRQRDAYKKLLQRHSIPLPDSQSLGETSSSLHDDNEFIDEAQDRSIVPANLDQGMSSQSIQSQTVTKLEQSLCCLHAEFKQYREDKTRSDVIYTETIENLRKESTEAKILNQKLAAQLDFTHEKFRTLEANVENYKREISVLREMNARYTTSAAASDEALSSSRQQSARISDRLAESEVHCRHLIRQTEQLRANGERLSRELETERKTTLVHQKLMQQLQSIQAHLEHRNESEARQSVRRIEILEAQLEQVKKDALEKQDKLFSLNTALQAELTHVRQSLRAAEDEMAQLRMTIASAKTSDQSSDIGSSHTQSSAPSTSVDGESGPALSGADHPISVQLRNFERECASLRISLEAARKQCSEYQRLGNEMESHIHQLTQEREQAEKAHASELDDAVQQCESLTLQLELEKIEREDLGKEKARLEEEYAVSLKKLRDELTATQLSLKNAEERLESALAVEASSRAEVAAHLHTAKEAREKYEMELRLHSQDVELLTEARKLADEARAEVEGLRISLEAAESSLKQSETQLTEQSNAWEESRSRLVKRAEDADAELTEQLVNLRKLMENDNDRSVSLEESAGQIKESEDFMHLLEYLRRQKSIAEVAEETANAEVNRLHLRTKMLESQVADLQTKLSEERQKSETLLETSSQHNELMKQIEQVNLLNESNRLLRQEREVIREVAARSEEQLAVLRNEMEPLRIKCSDLEDAKEILASEKRLLAEERDRWKERCTRLVETSKRMDPEEFKQACATRDQLQTRVLALEESLSVANRESAVRIADLEKQIADLSSSLAQHQSEGQDLTVKLAELEKTCTQQDHELLQRQVKITKLREIGRKYRQEADELRHRLLTTRQSEESRKTSEEGVVAFRAELLAAQANLQSEQERSSLLKHEIELLQQLIEQVEAMPEMEFVKEVPAGASIGSNLQSVHSSDIFNRFNSLLSALTARLGQMRSQIEEQAERLLRMQLIESQLTKTKRQFAELQSKLAPPISSSSCESITAAQSGEKADLQQQIVPTSSPETSSSKVSWGGSGAVKAAAAVQPVQTPPPTTSPGFLSAARQTAEIRPLPNFVATVLPTTTASSSLEYQTQLNSYLIPLVTSQHPESSVDIIESDLGSLPTNEPRPLSPSDERTANDSTDHVAGPSSSEFPPSNLSSTTKRTYEEALWSVEPQQSSEEGAIAVPNTPDGSNVIESSPFNVQTSKRLRPATPSSGQPSTIPNIASTLPVITTDFELDANGDAPSRDTIEDEDEIEVSQEMENPVVIAREEEENAINSGVSSVMACEDCVSSDGVLVVDTSREDNEHSHQEAEDNLVEVMVEESDDRQSDYEVNDDGDGVITDDDEEHEGEDEEYSEESDAEEMEEEDEDRPMIPSSEEEDGAEGGADNPVIVSSGEEEDNEGDLGEGEVESDVEEKCGDEEMEVIQPVSDSQNENDDEVSQEPPTDLTSQPQLKASTSIFSPALGLFSSTLAPVSVGPSPSASGGLFSDVKPSSTGGVKCNSLFDVFSSSATGSVSTPQPADTDLIHPSTSLIAGSTTTISKAGSTSEGAVGGAGTSRQKIQPIVWTESSEVSRKHSVPPPTTSTAGLFRVAVTEGASGGVIGLRRKKRGSFGGIPGIRGAPRGGHR